MANGQVATEFFELLIVAHRQLSDDLARLREQSLLESDNAREWDQRFTEDRLTRVAREIATVSTEILGEDGVDGIAAKLAKDSYAAGLAISNDVSTDQGEAAVASANLTSIHAEQSQLIAQRLTNQIADMHVQLLRSEEDAYRRVQARASIIGNLTGAETGQVAANMIAEFRADGITRFPTTRRTKAGLPVFLKIEDWAAMSARTVSANATREALLQRSAEADNDLVIITGGIRPNTDDVCEFFNGTILSISGQDHPDVPNFAGSLDAAIGDGLFHPNCYHLAVPWVPDVGPSEMELVKRANALATKYGVDEGEFAASIEKVLKPAA